MTQTICSFTMKQNEIPIGQRSDPEELLLDNSSSPARKVFFSEIFLLQ